MTSSLSFGQSSNKLSSLSSSPSLSLSLRIWPGYGLGAFLLGLPLNKVLKLLRINGNIFPQVNIRYQLNNPLLSDITVDLSNIGVRLRFDAHSQRLRFIEIYPSNIEKPSEKANNNYDFFTHSLELLYSNHVCSNARVKPTFDLIYHNFGPTYPGRYNAKNKSYTLQYPGVCFVFPLQPSNIPSTDQLNADETNIPFPLQTEEGKSPVASRIFIHFGANINHAFATLPISMEHLHQLPSSILTFPLVSNTVTSAQQHVNAAVFNSLHARNSLSTTTPNTTTTTTTAPSKANTDTISVAIATDDLAYYWEPVQAFIGKGIFFTKRRTFVGFDSSVQDLLSDLGAPSAIYYKENDPSALYAQLLTDFSTLAMDNDTKAAAFVEETTSPSSAHSASSIMSPQSSAQDYIYNYFSHGIDIVLDGISHRVKKIILRTNLINTPDFGQYNKCNFFIANPNLSQHPTLNSRNSTPSLRPLASPPISIPIPQSQPQSQSQSQPQLNPPQASGSSQTPAPSSSTISSAPTSSTNTSTSTPLASNGALNEFALPPAAIPNNTTHTSSMILHNINHHSETTSSAPSNAKTSPTPPVAPSTTTSSSETSSTSTASKNKKKKKKNKDKGKEKEKDEEEDKVTPLAMGESKEDHLSPPTSTQTEDDSDLSATSSPIIQSSTNSPVLSSITPPVATATLSLPTATNSSPSLNSATPAANGTSSSITQTGSGSNGLLAPPTSNATLNSNPIPYLDSDSHWNQVVSVLGPCPTRPVAVSPSFPSPDGVSNPAGNKARPTHSHTSKLKSPFHPTLFYAYKGIIFEVLKTPSNSQTATQAASAPPVPTSPNAQFIPAQQVPFHSAIKSVTLVPPSRK